MQNFNLTRFINTLRWQLSERKGIYTFAAIGFLLTIFPTLIFPFISGAFSHDDYELSGSSTAMVITATCAGWYMVTCGALIVADLGNKRQRIAAFMLPASQLEKFTARYLQLIVALPLAFIAGIVVADLLQMGICQLTLGDSLSVIAQFFSIDKYAGTANAFHSFYGFVSAWYVHSLFLLAGSFFRRHAWILSNILLFFSATLVLGGVAFIAKELFEAFAASGQYRVGIITTPLTKVLYTLAILLVIAFNYWATFRIYSRLQAVNNKLINF